MKRKNEPFLSIMAYDKAKGWHYRPIKGSKVNRHLCNDCQYPYPECPATEDDVIFDGENITECDEYKEKE